MRKDGRMDATHAADKKTNTARPRAAHARPGSASRWIARPGRLVVAIGVTGLLTALAGAVWAQEVGTVAELDGGAEIGRGGTWTPANVGAAIQQGDKLRTKRPGRMRVVFQDDSVLTLSDNSE